MARKVLTFIPFSPWFPFLKTFVAIVSRKTATTRISSSLVRNWPSSLRRREIEVSKLQAFLNVGMYTCEEVNLFIMYISLLKSIYSLHSCLYLDKNSVNECYLSLSVLCYSTIRLLSVTAKYFMVFVFPF